MSLNNVYIRTLRPEELLEEGRGAQRWDRVDFSEKNRLARRGSLRWTLPRPVEVHGIAVWWTAELVPGVALTTSPLALPTHWEQLFFPALAPIALDAGETLVAEIRARSTEDSGTDLAWTLAVLDRKGTERDRQAMSLSKGFLP